MKRIAVLFVHGFTGNNAIFDFLTPLVPSDYHVEQFTLDGHGGDAKAFSRTSMQKWKEQVADIGGKTAEVGGFAGIVGGLGGVGFYAVAFAI